MRKKVIPAIEDFIDLNGFNNDEVNLIKRAFSFASTAHEDQLRLSGEPFIIHPLNVTKMLVEMGFDAKVISAALLHDTVEDTGI
jgi:GTP pyrophosphokinase